MGDTYGASMALSAEADYVLRTIEERGIRFVRLWFTDVLGFLKSFTITSQELEGAFLEGMGFDGSSIEGFSRIQESDMIAIPDPATFQIIPWQTEQAVARMFCDIYDPDGTPFDGDPRGVLKRQLQRASDLGFTFYVGPELEFFYFKSIDDPTPLDQGGYFDETPLDVATDYRKRTVVYLEAMGIPVEYVHHEVAPSQHEIDLRYSDALTMADNVMTYRLTVKEVAQEFGVYATFMPKPIVGMNGSGMHTHQSLFEGDRNAFFDPNDEYHLSKTAKSYIAGILRHAPEITLVTNQWVNSYKRLIPGVRSAGVRLLGAPQPIRARPRPRLQAGEGGRDAHRVPLARPRVQPVPGVLRDDGPFRADDLTLQAHFPDWSWHVADREPVPGGRPHRSCRCVAGSRPDRDRGSGGIPRWPPRAGELAGRGGTVSRGVLRQTGLGRVRVRPRRAGRRARRRTRACGSNAPRPARTALPAAPSQPAPSHLPISNRES